MIPYFSEMFSFKMVQVGKIFVESVQNIGYWCKSLDYWCKYCSFVQNIVLLAQNGANFYRVQNVLHKICLFYSFVHNS